MRRIQPKILRFRFDFTTDFIGWYKPEARYPE